MGANAEMIQGYLDGHDPDCPNPSANRTRAYRHGFQNGRDDIGNKPRNSAANLRRAAEQAISDDAEA